MKKKISIRYGGMRIPLDAIGPYWATFKANDRTREHRHGIHFILRNGEVINPFGNDEISRDEVIAFLDKHFDTVAFDTNKCHVCTNKIKSCDHNCQAYAGYPDFKRKENIKGGTDT